YQVNRIRKVENKHIDSSLVGLQAQWTRGMDEFKFAIGDVVLAEWEDKLFYAKIQKIDKVKSYCHLIFDDNSVEECPFSKIHSVTETTAEIVCIICKDGTSAQPNEIVLCDKCGIGYHQKCHVPPIPAKALEIDEPWMCTYCTVGAFCPYLENPFEAKEKRTDPLRRRIQPLSGENSVVTNSWNSHGHRLLAKKPVTHSMSGFYYTSPSQHREGHRPRGRPPFSHKKHINDKRGRGIGRSPNRNPSRERDHQQNERDSEQEVNSRKHYSKHNSEMQHRTHSRYNSPSRTNRHGEDVDSSGSDRSQSNKDSDSIPNSNTVRKENNSNKSAVLVVKHHRRDPPREKQRLTQDLARQKRLLSEDLARNQLLQREQLTTNYDITDSAQDQCETVEDKEDCSSEKDGQLTMYEKCYGNYSAVSPGDEFPEEIQRDIKNSSCDNMKQSEALFERVLNRGSVAETKHIEFVNESQLEMRSDEEKNEVDHVNAKPLSPTSDTTSRGDLNRKVKLPVFENVTDDELTISDNEGSVHLKNLHDVSSNALVSGSEVVLNVNCFSDTQSQDSQSSEKVLGKVKNACSPKELVNDCNDKIACDCSTHEGSDYDTSVYYNGNESKELSLKTDQQSDHSTIKASKMSQILDEPDMQCEHSLRNENLKQDGVDNGISIPCDLKSSKNILNTEGNACDRINSKDSLDAHNEGTASPDHAVVTGELENNRELDNASVEQDTDVSNNEGMSDAEELTDSEPVTSSGKAKMKRKTRKKPKSAKNLIKIANSPQRQPRRSKTGRRLGRPPKTSKQPRHIDSDSDEQDHLNCEIKGENKDTRSKSQSPPKELSAADSTQEISKQHEDSNEFEDKTSKEEDALEESKDVDAVEEDPHSPDSQHQDSDTEDANQEIFSLTEAERLQYEEQERKERARKDKRIAARQKRKSVERDREKERATPPHLVSQNRFARDLPRHNWLVERLLQQKKLGQEALKQDDDDDAEGNSDEESARPNDDISISDTNINPELESELQDKVSGKDSLSDGGEVPKEDPASPLKDDFQSELHRSFLRRSFPPNVPRSPPKLKPASPENTNSENKPSMKHKLHTKDHTILEPVPKLKKIVPEKSTKEIEEPNSQEQASNDNEGPKDNESSRKQQSPIEIIDDDEEKKKGETETDSKTSKSSSSPIISSAEKIASKDEDSSSKCSSFSPPKKPLLYSSPKKVVHSVSPTLPGCGKDMGTPHPMGPHHRAAILIPVVPMHDANGLPLPPSLGPPSPHMKPYSPRTFTPHLITHNAPFSTAGLFSGPPPNRYPAGSCHHHFHPGIKPGPCKRDLNCPFHGSPTLGGILPGGILGIPTHHHPSMTAFNSPHEHISHILAREHREGHCPNSDCKLCRQGKESPKIRELDPQLSSEKKSPQPSKVVKPIAHVPGMRPPLMLSHLQQFGGRLAHSYPDIDSIQEEKARRTGMEALLSSRPKLNSTSPDRSSRDPMVPGLFLQERRSLPQSLTLSELNRRREQEFLKGPQDSLLSINKHRSMPGDFFVPGFSPPSSLSKPGLIHPKDSTFFSSSRSQPVMTSQTEKRDLHRLEERERNAFLISDSLKSGPPRLRSLEEKLDVHALRNFNEHKKREEMARRDNQPVMRHIPTTKEGTGMPPAKLFEDRDVPRDQSRDPSMTSFSRPNKDFDMRLLSSHGNSSILGPGLRNLEENRKVTEEERKGITREEREQETRRSVDSETREREIREEQAMNALEASHRRSIEQMREKEQEKRVIAERDGMRGLTPMERDRMKHQIMRGPEAEKHFKTFGMPRERSPPFLRRDMFHERLLNFDPSKADHRLDLRTAALHDLQRRQELFRAGEGSHRELLGRIASSYSANKTNHPAEKHFPERFHPEMSRLTDIRSHSPTRGYPLSLASRQAMDRLAAAAQGKSIQISKDMEKEIPLHLRTEMEREREKERHRLSLEQIDVNRRLLQAELKEKVNPLVLNREIGPRDREKEMAALRARERLMLERERHMAFERLAEERRRKRDAGELDGPFLLQSRHLPSPPYGRALSEFERAKRMRIDDHMSTPSSYSPLMAPHTANSFEGKSKDDRLTSPKGVVDQRIGRPLDLELPNKNANSMLERDALWLRERERVMRAKEELSRIQPKVSHSHTNHLPGFVNSKERPEGIPRESEGSGKPEDESVNLCSVCKRDASFLCSGCQGAWYCSTECQVRVTVEDIVSHMCWTGWLPHE
ncbi:hypothetical protein QZH41_008342, partial [Actinostola sp. cb2023]